MFEESHRRCQKSLKNLGELSVLKESSTSFHWMYICTSYLHRNQDSCSGFTPECVRPESQWSSADKKKKKKKYNQFKINLPLAYLVIPSHSFFLSLFPFLLPFSFTLFFPFISQQCTGQKCWVWYKEHDLHTLRVMFLWLRWLFLVISIYTLARKPRVKMRILFWDSNVSSGVIKSVGVISA